MITRRQTRTTTEPPPPPPSPSPPPPPSPPRKRPKIMLTNDFLRSQHRNELPLKRKRSRAAFESVSNVPTCIRRINKKRLASDRDPTFTSSHLERRLVLTFDTALLPNQTPDKIFSENHLTTKIFSLLSRKKNTKGSYFNNGLLISQQQGRRHIINSKISDPNISFESTTCTSLVKAISQREIGRNFRSCNNGGPANKHLKGTYRVRSDLNFQLPHFLCRYKNARIFFSDEIFDLLHHHPYRKRLYSGWQIISRLHSETKKKSIFSLLGKYSRNVRNVVEFWWECTSIKFFFKTVRPSVGTSLTCEKE